MGGRRGSHRAGAPGRSAKAALGSLAVALAYGCSAYDGGLIADGTETDPLQGGSGAGGANVGGDGGLQPGAPGDGGVDPGTPDAAAEDASTGPGPSHPFDPLTCSN